MVEYQEYPHKYRDLRKVRQAEHILKFWQDHSFTELIEVKSGLNDLISGLRQYIYYMDNKYSLELVKYGIRHTSTQFHARLKQEQTGYIEHYKVLVRAIRVRNAFNSLISTVYKETYINKSRAEEVLKELEDRVSGMFPEQDRLLIKSIKVIAECLSILDTDKKE